MGDLKYDRAGAEVRYDTLDGCLALINLWNPNGFNAGNDSSAILTHLDYGLPFPEYGWITFVRYIGYHPKTRLIYQYHLHESRFQGAQRCTKSQWR